MLLRHAKLLSSIVLIWDVVCLQFVWSILRLHYPDLGKAAWLFDGWNLIALGTLWIACLFWIVLATGLSGISLRGVWR